MANVVKKNQKADVPTKNGKNYSYQYVDIAQIHEYLESINSKYIQVIKRIDNDDYVMTKRCFDDKWEEEWLQGCKVVDATLYGNDNPAQKQGSALTYARRYSLLMAYGLATEDDDANSLNKFTTTEEVKEPTKEDAENYVVNFGKYSGKKLVEVIKDDWYRNYLLNGNDEYIKKCIVLLTGKDENKEHDERIKLINEINSLELETDTAHEEMLGHFKVNGVSEMTILQLRECKEILEKKLYKQITTDDIKKD